MFRYSLPALFLLLRCTSTAVAQEHLRLAGYLQVPGKPLMSYYVEVSISGTTVKGYSITDWTGGSRMRAALTGVRSPLSEIYIQENALLDGAHSPLTTFCYFTAKLKLTIIKGRQRWNGPFESRQTDGSLCDRGIMTLFDDAPDLDAPKPKLKPIAPPVPLKPKVIAELPKPKPKTKLIIPPKPAPVAVIDTPKRRPVIVIPPPSVPVVKRDTARPRPVVKVTAPPPVVTDVPDSCLRRYDWSSATLELDVFDGWSVDGDVVSVAIGGHTLMDHMTLSREKQHFSVPLSKGWNTLFVALHEDGYDPPVTPNLVLTDGDKKYELEVSGDVGQVAWICIFRK